MVVAWLASTAMEPPSRSSPPSVRATAGGGPAPARPAPEVAGAAVAHPPADVEEQRIAVERLTVVELDVAQPPNVAVKANDGRLDDGDADRLHTRELVGSEVVRTVAEQDDVV